MEGSQKINYSFFQLDTYLNKKNSQNLDNFDNPRTLKS